MLQRVSDDLDNIYNHIADDFKEIGTAEKMADALENAILSLDEMPYPLLLLYYSELFVLMIFIKNYRLKIKNKNKKFFKKVLTYVEVYCNINKSVATSN